MRKTVFLIAAVSASWTGALFAQEDKKDLSVDAFERSQGWQALFDGRSFKGWRAYDGKNAAPENWSVVDGAMIVREGQALSTIDEHRDFEFSFEFKIMPGGDATVFLHAVEEKTGPVGKGMMMELAGAGHVPGGNGGFTTPSRSVTILPGEWYEAKAISFGYKLEYYLNGELVLSYLASDLDPKTARPPDSDVKLFGRPLAGVIVLQGREAAFKNIKIKSL